MLESVLDLDELDVDEVMTGIYYVFFIVNHSKCGFKHPEPWTPFLGRLLFKITDPNHKTRYPKKGRV